MLKRNKANFAPLSFVLGRRFRLALLFCGALYLAACVVCAVGQRRLIFFPPLFTAEQVDVLAKTAKLERWRNSAGQAIGMMRASPTQPSAGRVLLVYGNGSCATGCARYADAIQQVVALDVFILEYPGYADRPGNPSQESLFRAADEGLRLLGTNGPLYLVGESLGTGVAAYLAGTYPDRVAGVALFAPYNRLADVAQYPHGFVTSEQRRQRQKEPARVAQLIVSRCLSRDFAVGGQL
jgi:pimeloyl-ACP methyl ester carboxylesterase